MAADKPRPLLQNSLLDRVDTYITSKNTPKTLKTSDSGFHWCKKFENSLICKKRVLLEILSSHFKNGIETILWNICYQQIRSQMIRMSQLRRPDEVHKYARGFQIDNCVFQNGVTSVNLNWQLVLHIRTYYEAHITYRTRLIKLRPIWK